MDWTKPLHKARPMGIEWLVELRTKTENEAAGDDSPALRRGDNDFYGSKGWRARMSPWQYEIGCGVGQSFAAELVGPNS